MKTDLSTLKVVRVGAPLPMGTLQTVTGRILEAFTHVIRDLHLVQYDPPEFDEIEADLLTGALHQEVGGHILGITAADLVDRRGDGFFGFMFGGKDNRNDVAVVSIRRLVRRDGTLALERVLKVALHELGHNFGLVHHYSLEPAVGGGYCPMSKGDYNRFGERGYLRAIVDGRGLSFCRSCLDFLRGRRG